MILRFFLFNQTQQAAQQNPLVSLLPIIIMFGALYLLFILPQQRADKKHKEMLKNLKKGDKVLTQSGLMGIITNVKDDLVYIEIAPKVEIKMLKSSVTRLMENDTDVKDA